MSPLNKQLRTAKDERWQLAAVTGTDAANVCLHNALCTYANDVHCTHRAHSCKL